MRIIVVFLVAVLVSGCGFFSGLGGSKRKNRAEGFTGPVHQKHAGKIVFSKSPIPRAPASEAALATEFTLEDPIYIRPFLADAGHNLLATDTQECADRGNWRLFAMVNDGKRQMLRRGNVTSGAMAEHQTFSLMKQGEADAMNLTAEMKAITPSWTWQDRWNAIMVPQMKPGKNTVKLDLEMDCLSRAKRKEKPATLQTLAATASFVVELGPTSMLDYLKRTVGTIKAAKLPKGITASDMQAEAQAFFKKAKHGDGSTYGEVIAFLNQEPKWNIAKHRLTGRTLRRYIKGKVFTRETPTSECVMHWVRFSQEAINSSSFQKGADMYASYSTAYPCPLVALK